jgi:hypothetical protein
VKRLRERLTLLATLMLAVAWFLNRKGHVNLADAVLLLAILTLCVSLVVKEK